MALNSVMKTIMGSEPQLVPLPDNYDGNEDSFFADMAGALVGVGLVTNSLKNPGHAVLDKDALSMTKFLNR